MTRSGIQLCYPFEEKRLAKWPKPWIIQPKLDGERCRALIDENGQVTLMSSECNIFKHIPHINVALEELGLHNVELDGELYQHDMAFEDIHSIVSRKANIHNDFDAIEYHIFDVVNSERQVERTLWLRNELTPMLREDGPLKIISYSVVDCFAMIEAYMEEVEKQGYEGFVIRNAYAPYVRKRSTEVMKFKPRKSDYYTIIGSVEEVSIEGVPKNALGSLVCTSDEGTKFNVGSGPLLTREARIRLWEERDTLPGKLIHIKYQHLTTKEKVPRFPIAIEIIDPLARSAPSG